MSDYIIKWPETYAISGLCRFFASDVQDFPVDNRFEEALVYFVAYKCYLDDDADTVNANLAESYLGKFSTKAQL